MPRRKVEKVCAVCGATWLASSAAVRTCSPLCRAALRESEHPTKGQKNPAWKGDGLDYDAAHKRVRSLRGKASQHRCVDCDEAAHEWSYNGGCPREQRSPVRDGCAFSPDPDRYSPRCRRCHSAYDSGGLKRPNGQWMTREERASDPTAPQDELTGGLWDQLNAAIAAARRSGQ